MLLSAPLLAACTGGEPDIIRVSPAKGDTSVPPDAAIAVTFDRAMDHQSVERRLSVKPEIPGCDASTCAPTWSGNTISLRHDGHGLALSTSYHVTLARGYRDTHGQVNSFDHAWDFTTASPPTVGTTAPSAGATGVQVDADVFVQFSRAMRLPPAGAVVIDPAVPFDMRLDPADASRLVISPLRLLQPATPYRVTLSRSITDTHGANLASERVLAFTTGGLNLARSLALAAGGTPTTGYRRILELRPPPTLQSRDPSLRILYESAAPILDFGWSGSGQALWVLEGPQPGGLRRVDLVTGGTDLVAPAARSMAPSPVADEVAYVDAQGLLHLWATGHDTGVPGLGAVEAQPAWSADGGRLALVAGPSARLVIVDRSTLASYQVAGTASCPACAAPRWAFDGSEVAFVGSAPPGNGLLTFRPAVAAATGLRLLAPGEPPVLSWAADGTQVYAVFEGGISVAPAHPLAGPGAFTPLAGTRSGDGEPAVPAYDRRLGFVRVVDGVPQVWLMNSDGSGQRALTRSGPAGEGLTDSGAGLPRWAPAGP